MIEDLTCKRVGHQVRIELPTGTVEVDDTGTIVFKQFEQVRGILHVRDLIGPDGRLCWWAEPLQGWGILVGRNGRRAIFMSGSDLSELDLELDRGFSEQQYDLGGLAWIKVVVVSDGIILIYESGVLRLSSKGVVKWNLLLGRGNVQAVRLRGGHIVIRSESGDAMLDEHEGVVMPM